MTLQEKRNFLDSIFVEKPVTVHRNYQHLEILDTLHKYGF